MHDCWLVNHDWQMANHTKEPQLLNNKQQLSAKHLTNHNCQLINQDCWLTTDKPQLSTNSWQTIIVGWKLKNHECWCMTDKPQLTTDKQQLSAREPILKNPSCFQPVSKLAHYFQLWMFMPRCCWSVPGRGWTCPPPTTRTGPPPPECYVERSGYQDHASHSVSLKTGGITSGYVRNFRHNPNVS